MSNLVLARNELFEGNQADFYHDSETYFMTANQLAKCLGYADRKGLDKVVERNPYIKTAEFSVTDKLTATDGKVYNTRLFNEDGIYEVAFLSKTAIAQIFRAWVRKILKELRRQSQQPNQLSTAEQISALDERVTRHDHQIEQQRVLLQHTQLDQNCLFKSRRETDDKIKMLTEKIEARNYALEIPAKPLVSKKHNTLDEVFNLFQNRQSHTCVLGDDEKQNAKLIRTAKDCLSDMRDMPLPTIYEIGKGYGNVRERYASTNKSRNFYIIRENMITKLCWHFDRIYRDGCNYRVHYLKEESIPMYTRVN